MRSIFGAAASLLLAVSAEAAVKAFPTAEGFGAVSIGGRGGSIVFVTNLNDSGPGSLRQALQFTTGPRIVVFRVGGTITLTNVIRIIGESGSYVTIAGQTAPGGGIQLTGYGIQMENAHDIVIRHIRSRPRLSGVDSPNHLCGAISGLELLDSYNVVVDHSSFSWNIDEGVSSHAFSHDVTIQRSLIAEGILDGKKDLPLSCGASGVDAKTLRFDRRNQRVDAHHNLLMTSRYRNPAVNGGDPRVINNLIYNWSMIPTQIDSDNSFLTTPDVINNYYKHGPETDGFTTGIKHPVYVLSQCTTALCSIHMAGNVVVNSSGGTPSFVNPTDNFSLATLQSGAAYTRRFTPHTIQPMHPMTIQTAVAARDSILVAGGVGATVPARDSYDTKLINDVINVRGTIPRKATVAALPILSNGTPPIDSDNDGMPNTWETAHGLNPGDPADGPRTAANGYTNVENYLNALAGDPVFASLPGDLHGDGARTLIDVRWLIEMLVGSRDKTTVADLDHDGNVTLADCQALIRLLVGIP